ncbi:TRAP transporter substrate-binding protein [Paramaledivibacter caminithermalis]|jgi:tripartite ATP-independent transporter DctP family solute receptor|uniref:Tripartite ATP-independent transporter solute receptor, DctP family n=1 Tax=Paramaledivibacter caminithermalis (strain DSM 15212 / CIP 107654 / DViRD3) TaxID=1121301 RepID=A0A1M6NTM9_PARC5|nr:TRAP transporter substrate-binding protein [Paramaledivibacter caminithermalis]SHJ99005.1 tripartite ATP-independent transporter solute receptor, DctP family [Paramaledivibacter caminithermalis DSM 15212]
MKRFLSIFVALVLVIGMLSGCGAKQEETQTSQNPAKESEKTEPIVLRLADVHNDGYPTVIGDREFARLVEERTDGRIKVEVYPGGQLGDEKTVIEQVQFGAIDLTRTSISPLTEFQKKLSVLMLPYIYRDKEHMFKVLDGPMGEEFLNGLSEANMLGLCWYDAGARSFYNSKKEIKTVEDLKGLKIRVQKSEIMLDLVKALGASPTPMAFSEVYSAIQTGVIDGAENNWASYLTTSHYEVAKYYTVDEHTRVPEMILMSKMTFDKLSPEDQKIIKEAAKEAALVEREEWAKAEAEAEEKIVANGNIVTRLESKDEFQKAVSSLYDKYGADYKDLIEKIINTK